MVEPPTFPEFFFFGMLRAANWPRNAGFMKKKAVVDPRIVDQLRDGLAQIGVTLGAGRPALGAQLLADIFRDRDWLAWSFSELLSDLDPSDRVAEAPTKLPWEAISQKHGWRLRLAQEPDITKPELMPWDGLDAEFRAQLGFACAEGLIWGLLHPAEAVDAINRHSAELSKNMPMLIRAGLGVDPGFSPPNMEQSVSDAEEMVNSYQAECRQLVPLPATLRQSPELLRRLGADGSGRSF
jgi:hypothetical protein